MTEQQIAAGARIRAFLGDEAVTDTVARLKADYAAQWLLAKTPQERESLHARATALDDVMTALRAVDDSGYRAQVERDRKAAATKAPHRK